MTGFLKKQGTIVMLSLMSQEENEYLDHLAHQSPRGQCIELGCFQGYSTTILCNCFGQANVIAIDNFKMQHHGTNFRTFTALNVSKKGYFPLILELESTIVPHQLFDQVDFLLIDTDHKTDVLRKELTMWLPYLKSGAFVVMHDYSHENYYTMAQYIDGFFRQPNWTSLGVVDTLIAFKWNG
jgi:predicted O-methyltransferase YrrM